MKEGWGGGLASSHQSITVKWFYFKESFKQFLYEWANKVSMSDLFYNLQSSVRSAYLFSVTDLASWLWHLVFSPTKYRYYYKTIFRSIRISFMLSHTMKLIVGSTGKKKHGSFVFLILVHVCTPKSPTTISFLSMLNISD